jgi:2-keto-4-pentenoate hydratase/2-oxohepta-3-ene-1,7-dioic acid hydratase in catechol pathway
MRYCRFQTANGPRYGRIERGQDNDQIVELISFSSNHAARTENFSPIPLAKVQLLAPVQPTKIIGVGRNYRDHASELGNEVPAEPLLFLKPTTSLLSPGAVIQLPPATLTQRVDFEGELGVIIGKRARNIRADEDVRDYIRGFTCVNDVTARDLQKKDGQFTRAKGFDTFCPVGPIVVTPDEFDLHTAQSPGVEVTTKLNGTERQHGHTRDFIFALDFVLRYITKVMTLEPGDLISTGTPAGVGQMKAGDVVEVTVSGIGTLRNTVA